MPPTVPSGSDHWPMVGREVPLNLFTKVLDDAHCHAFLLHGTPGVGKSRLAEECVRRAQQRGHRTARVVATRAASSIPLGALAHLLPADLHRTDPTTGFADAITALAARRDDKRLVLMIDDLHWLDSSSASLVGQLLDFGSVILVGTIRVDLPAGEAVHAFDRGDHTVNVDLEDLDGAQTENLITKVLGGVVGVDTLDALHATSGGNPLFLRELISDLLDSHSLVHGREGWQWVWSRRDIPRLRKLIGQRLSGMGEEDNKLLRTLALTEEISLTDALSVTSEAALVNLESRGVINVRMDGRRIIVTLAHPLYADVVLIGTPPDRRQSLLLSEVGRIESYGMRRRDDVLRVAAMQLSATGTAEPEYLLHAARLARLGDDYAQVNRLVRSIPRECLSAEGRALLGESWSQLGQFDEAEKVLITAQAVAESSQSHILTMMRIRNFAVTGNFARALEIIASRRSTITHCDMLRDLDASEGIVRSLTGETSRPLSLLSDVENITDDRFRLTASLVKAWLLAMRGTPIEAAELAEQSYREQCQLTGRGRIEYHIGNWPAAFQLWPLSLACAESGQLKEAGRIAEQGISETSETKAPYPYIWLLFGLARSHWLAGRAADANQAYHKLREVAQRRQMRLALSGEAASAAVLGDVAGAVQSLSSFHNYPRSTALAGEEDLGHAWVQAVSGEYRTAVEILSDAAIRAHRTEKVVSEVLLLTDIARLGEPDSVIQRLEDVARHANGAFIPARVRLVTALASRDPRALAEASRELERLGANLLAAEASAEEARVWKQRKQGRKEAAAWLRTRVLASRCQGARTPLLAKIPESSHLLSSRELEVALLVSAGASRNVVADRLVLSPRTVDSHLEHVYAKLGVSNRYELRQALRFTGYDSPGGSE